MPDHDLNVAVSDTVTLRDELVGSPSKPLGGFVALLDALGAKNYTAQEADQFLKSRDEFIPFICSIAEQQITIDSNDFQRFISGGGDDQFDTQRAVRRVSDVVGRPPVACG